MELLNITLDIIGLSEMTWFDAEQKINLEQIHILLEWQQAWG